ncbi:MAG: Na(+)-translocating NADH-quinone reductase subunit A [Duncaniella sp.]|nr:Na(+)-translocating NADH-quinone reductase subunit A [Duncaniella sp.]
MRRTINLRKGLNLNLEGALPADAHACRISPARVAVIPDDFPGFLPKLDVKEGDVVKVGQSLLHDKNDEDVKLVSPAAGVVEAVVRGARRKIERVIVKVNGDDHVAFDTASAKSADSLRKLLKNSGLWAMMRRRPYDIIPLSDDTPRDIFVTAMDTAPLAPSLYDMVKDCMEDVKAGVEAMSMLTDGAIYIGVENDSDFPDVAGAEIVEFPKLHPAGNAGVQAANIRPVNKGEAIWTLDIVTLAKIGKLIATGSLDISTFVAEVGSELKEPRLIATLMGASLDDLLYDDVKSDGRHHRIISGNVLTGVTESLDGYLHYPYRQITVIPEGDDANEFMGWASMSPSKMSVNRSFLGHFLNRKFNPDARLNGGRRAMIMSEQYDKVFPMDILPEYLIKAIITKDIDRMEALGIYEVAPEDFALAEYVDPSKLELQKIVREGLEYLRSEV